MPLRAQVEWFPEECALLYLHRASALRYQLVIASLTRTVDVYLGTPKSKRDPFVMSMSVRGTAITQLWSYYK